MQEGHNALKLSLSPQTRNRAYELLNVKLKG